MFVEARTQRRIRTLQLGAAALCLSLLVGAVRVPSANAAVACRADPVVTLSNGATSRPELVD